MSIKLICKAKEKETWEVFSITVENLCGILCKSHKYYTNMYKCNAM